jgi:hypothetical protein
MTGGDAVLEETGETFATVEGQRLRGGEVCGPSPSPSPNPRLPSRPDSTGLAMAGPPNTHGFSPVTAATRRAVKKVNRLRVKSS